MHTVDDFQRERTGPGAGLQAFTREDKRLCGFLYLRANRTGTRALSFGRGSLLDTIARLETSDADGTHSPLWAETLDAVAAVDLDEGAGLLTVLDEVTARARKFVNLSPISRSQLSCPTSPANTFATSCGSSLPPAREPMRCR